MPGWDYGGNGCYFITLVVQNRECLLGKIYRPENGKPFIQLSDFGQIVDNEWKKSFEIRDELYCDEYRIMPNHLHAIVILKKRKNTDDNKMNSMDGGTEKQQMHGAHEPNELPDSFDMNDTHVETHGLQHVETHGRASPHGPSPFFRKPKSISSFIAGFKSAVNTAIDNFIDEHKLNMPKFNRNNHFFQPNYHDHIIRNKDEYDRIKKYIINNPLHWNDDSFNPSNSETNG